MHAVIIQKLLYKILNFPVRVAIILEIVDKSKFSIRSRLVYSISRNRSSSVCEYWIPMDTCSLNNINSSVSKEFRKVLKNGTRMLQA